jgi:hypothetical protein
MGMVLSQSGQKLFATMHADKIAVIDTATDRLLGSIPIPGQPARVTWTPSVRVDAALPSTAIPLGTIATCRDSAQD